VNAGPDFTKEHRPPAERATAMRAGNTPSSPLLKEFTYDAGGGSNLGNGKVATATRHNYVPTDGDYVVTESFQYNDTAGHLTDKTTTVTVPGANGGTRSVTQSQSYDPLGLPAAILYPACVANCGAANKDRIPLP